MALFNRNRGEEKAEMTFIDHLEELRQHIIRSVIAILLMAIVIFIYRDWVFDNIITGPINPDFISYRLLCSFSHWAHMGDALCMPPVNINMQTTTFGGQFLSSISLALIGGILIAFPYIFWEFWRFIKPALKDKELKNLDTIFIAVKKINKLESRNEKLQLKIDNYQLGTEQRWALFKVELNNELDELGKSISRMAERNQKK